MPDAFYVNRYLETGLGCPINCSGGCPLCAPNEHSSKCIQNYVRSLFTIGCTCEELARSKKRVKYIEVRYLRKGESCLILPMDHPSPLVSNAPKWAVTSLVLNIDYETGEIETENTVYMLHKEED